MAITRKRYWGVVLPQPAAQLVEFAKQAEARGLEGLWGVQVSGPPFLPLATVAAGAERLKLGTGVALAFTRSPLETAMSALDLDIISGGRVVLGIGPSTQFINEDWHGVSYRKPLQRLKEAATLIRLIMEKGHTGKLGKWHGTYYKVDLSGFTLPRPPVRPRIPLYLSALFTGAVRLAAEVGDGLAGHPVWSLQWIRDRVIPHLAEGLRRASKTRQDFDLNIWAYVAISKDRRQAIADARGTVAFYSSIRQYEKYFAAHGFGAAARQAATAMEHQDHKAMIAAIPDEMVETFAVVGSPEEVRGKINSLWELSDSLTLLEPSYFLRPDQVAAYQQAIAEVINS